LTAEPHQHGRDCFFGCRTSRVDSAHLWHATSNLIIFVCHVVAFVWALNRTVLSRTAESFKISENLKKSQVFVNFAQLRVGAAWMPRQCRSWSAKWHVIAATHTPFRRGIFVRIGPAAHEQRLFPSASFPHRLKCIFYNPFAPTTGREAARCPSAAHCMRYSHVMVAHPPDLRLWYNDGEKSRLAKDTKGRERVKRLVDACG
jgi:hypothetical protein